LFCFFLATGPVKVSYFYGFSDAWFGNMLDAAPSFEIATASECKHFSLLHRPVLIYSTVNQMTIRKHTSQLMIKKVGKEKSLEFPLILHTAFSSK